MSAAGPRVADATAEVFDHLVAVMGVRGDPSRCWCQWFRVDRSGFGAQTADGRRAALREQAGTDPPPGVLVYDDAGVPSGWCAVAPRAGYARVVEGYPLDTTIRAASSAELFHGPLSVFLAAGFRETGPPARPRPGRSSGWRCEPAVIVNS